MKLMLAENYYESTFTGEFILTEKIDGIRCCLVKKGKDVKFYSRSEREIKGLIDIEKEAAKLPDGVYDGELVGKDFNNTIAITGSDGVKRGLIYKVFDCVYEDTCINRKRYLEAVIKNYKYIATVPILYIGSDTSVIEKLLYKVLSNGGEGLMLNVATAHYEMKRTKNLLKIKLFKTIDAKVVDITKGSGKYRNALGSIVVEFKIEGKKYDCNVGVGFKETERFEYYKNPELLIGQIVEIRYFQITKNEGGGHSLRFPTWINKVRRDL